MNICSWTQSSYSYTIKGGYSTSSPSLDTEPDKEILTNNTDSNFYVTATFDGTSVHVCNLAIWDDTGNGGYLYVPIAMKEEGYICGWEGTRRYFSDYCQNHANGAYWTGGNVYRNYSSNATNITSDLPIFTNKADFLAYISAPYIPPTKVSGGGGGFYGGYKGVIGT